MTAELLHPKSRDSSATSGVSPTKLVPSTGQDPAPVPAGAASRCPPRRLCSSRSPRRRAAPSHRSAARGCRRPARDPTGAGTEPGDPTAGSLVLCPPPQSPPVPAAPPGSERSPGAGRGARCRRWSCAAAPGSRTFLGDVGGVRHCPPHPHTPHRLLLAPYEAGHPPRGVGMDRGWAWWGCSTLGGAHQGIPWQSQEPNSPQKGGQETPGVTRGGAQPPPHHPTAQHPKPRTRNRGDSCAVPRLVGQEQPCLPQQRLFLAGGRGAGRAPGYESPVCAAGEG